MIMAATLTLGFTFSACSDDHMESLNTDSSKANELDPNAQLTSATYPKEINSLVNYDFKKSQEVETMAGAYDYIAVIW